MTFAFCVAEVAGLPSGHTEVWRHPQLEQPKGHDELETHEHYVGRHKGL